MIEERKRLINEYSAVVFDLDGTLYYQKQLRMTMAKRLAKYFISHPFELKDLLILKKFREVRDEWDDILVAHSEAVLRCVKPGETAENVNLDDLQYRYLAKKMHSKEEHVRSVITKWIHDNPLNAIKESEDLLIAQIIAMLRKLNVKVYIFSDYPIEDKMRAMGIKADGYYSATMPRINELKPSPKGLYIIMHDNDLNPEDILMIGDRDVKDGEAGRRAKVDYIILDGKREEREELYSRLFSELFYAALRCDEELL